MIMHGFLRCIRLCALRVRSDRSHCSHRSPRSPHAVLLVHADAERPMAVPGDRRDPTALAQSLTSATDTAATPFFLRPSVPASCLRAFAGGSQLDYQKDGGASIF